MDLFENYETLIAKVDEKCAETWAAESSRMACKAGCSTCCRHIGLFPVEAIRLRLALDTLSDERKAAIQSVAEVTQDEDACPLLENGICALYANRPIICRTHGFPILLEDGRTDFCPLNFTDGEAINEESKIALSNLNSMLAAVNQVFLKESGTEEIFGDERVPLADALLMELHDDSEG